MTARRSFSATWICASANLGAGPQGAEVCAGGIPAIRVDTRLSPAPQIGPPPVPIPFIANHPFLYFIRDNTVSEILFMGRAGTRRIRHRSAKS
jgi:serine protease inhibitor